MPRQEAHAALCPYCERTAHKKGVREYRYAGGQAARYQCQNPLCGKYHLRSVATGEIITPPAKGAPKEMRPRKMVKRGDFEDEVARLFDVDLTKLEIGHESSRPTITHLTTDEQTFLTADEREMAQTFTRRMAILQAVFRVLRNRAATRARNVMAVTRG